MINVHVLAADCERSRSHLLDSLGTHARYLLEWAWNRTLKYICRWVGLDSRQKCYICPFAIPLICVIDASGGKGSRIAGIGVATRAASLHVHVVFWAQFNLERTGVSLTSDRNHSYLALFPFIGTFCGNCLHHF